MDLYNWVKKKYWMFILKHSNWYKGIVTNCDFTKEEINKIMSYKGH